MKWVGYISLRLSPSSRLLRISLYCRRRAAAAMAALQFPSGGRLTLHWIFAPHRKTMGTQGFTANSFNLFRRDKHQTTLSQTIPVSPALFSLCSRAAPTSTCTTFRAGQRALAD